MTVHYLSNGKESAVGVERRKLASHTHPLGARRLIISAFWVEHLPAGTQRGAKITHPRQPTFKKHPILDKTGFLLLMFGTSHDCPAVLWCEECTRVVVMDEIPGHGRKAPHQPRGPQFDPEAINAAIPNLVKDIGSIKNIMKSHLSSPPYPQATQFIPKLATAFICVCGKAYGSEDSWNTHRNTERHFQFERGPAQNLNEVSKLAWYPISDDIEPTPPNVSSRATSLRQKFEGLLSSTPPHSPLPLPDCGDTLLFDILGWTDILKSFKPGFAGNMRRHTQFKCGDPLNLLPAFVSSYFGNVAEEAARPELLQASCSVLAGGM